MCPMRIDRKAMNVDMGSVARADPRRIEARQDAATNAAPVSSPSPSPPSTPPKKRGVRRDREFRRYAEAVVDLQASVEGEVAISSRDLSLTAYAQLVALRLNARRAMISLFDREKQYVIAEATRTLSLQKDAVHASCDGLWFGASFFDRSPGDFFRQTLKAHKVLAKDGTTGKRYFEANDLLKDARYKNHRFVVNEPFARSFAGVPLLTPNGYAIGTVSFFDDRPREQRLTDEEVTFMQDIAMTTMAQIEKTRLIVAHARGLRMVHGLSRFIEGKATADEHLDSSFRDAEDMQDRQTVQTSQLGASRRTHAMNAASNAERMEDYRRSQPFSFSKPRAVSDSSTEQQDYFHPRVPRAPGADEADPYSEDVVPESEALKPDVCPEHNENVPAQPEMLPKDPSDDLQEDLLSKDVRRTFVRAAAIINTAMSLSGTLFLDASVGEFGRLRSSAEGNMSSAESDVSRSETDGVKSEGDVFLSANKSRREATASGSFQRTSDDRQAHGTKSEDRRGIGQEDALKPCRNLASAYSLPPTTSGKSRVIHLPIPERYLKSLLHRFPYGKQWNFDPNGNTSSDEFSDSSVATDTTNKSDANKLSDRLSRRSRYRRQTDGQILSKLFPGVRSLALMPMYDAVRERFFAGAIVWSYDPIRVLTVQDDLNYLGAFCDVIMAEVMRLDAQAEAQTKALFLSSMSHELRSPLVSTELAMFMMSLADNKQHGILGGIECLQDKDNAAVQEDMLQMIESSGKSLLDIIDHLLEHAHATGTSDRRGSAKTSRTNNKVTRNRDGSVPRGTTKYNTDSSHQPPCDLALLTEEVLNTSLWATPKPNQPSEEERRRDIGAVANSTESIKVILEVDSSAMGEFRVNSGAWRRIVQNLASNALKYTDANGYLKVSLSAAPSISDSGGIGSSTTTVELVCLDSGRGMSQQFLKFGLWQAFSQENASSQGTGLGLSLVHGIVKEMGGTVDVQSSKGVGTAIRVRIPMRKRQGGSNLNADDANSTIQERLKLYTCAISGFEVDGEGNERLAQANGLLRKSITNACQTYGVNVVKEGSPRTAGVEARASQPVDITIMSERKAIQLMHLHGPEKTNQNNPTIVLCQSVASSRALPDLGPATIAVAQPLGPRKLLRALTLCLEKIRPNDAEITPTADNMGKTTETIQKGQGEVPSPLVLTSRPELTPVSSYFGALKPRSNCSVKSSRGTPSGLTTMLVDDNDINLTLLRAYMNKNKHAFVCASNGLEAVDAYKNSFAKSDLVLPTIILMDLTMPVMSGLESTRQIRAFERSNSIKPTSMIIALTAMSSSEARQEAFSSGVDMFLCKPVKLSALGKIIEKHMEERQISGRVVE